MTTRSVMSFSILFLRLVSKAIFTQQLILSLLSAVTVNALSNSGTVWICEARHSDSPFKALSLWIRECKSSSYASDISIKSTWASQTPKINPLNLCEHFNCYCTSWHKPAVIIKWILHKKCLSSSLKNYLHNVIPALLQRAT